MLVMRPVGEADLPQVMQLAEASPVGVASLPDDVERLQEKIRMSVASFGGEVSFNGEENYFFVLEDTTNGTIRACSAIIASAGFSEPFYSFRNETFIHASRELKIHNKIHVLSLCHDLTGNTLLNSFFVSPELLNTPYAELVSRSRLLFMACHPERFADGVVVEVVGLSDELGESPFWNGVGRNFFDIDYAEVERLVGTQSRTFIAELMPHYPLYVPLLSDAAQDAIGQFHPHSQQVFDLLTREGFEADNYIDILDGGPTLYARTSGLRTIAQSHVQSANIVASVKPGQAYLVCNDQLRHFRALIVTGEPDKPLQLTAEAAAALMVEDGDPIRAVTL